VRDSITAPKETPVASSTLEARTPAQTDTTWLRVVQLSLAVGVLCAVLIYVVLTFFTTVSEGDFRYAADYWLTANGLPYALAGIGLALGVHRLQHGADGRLGTIGVWVNTLALTELFAQLVTSVAVGAEVRWGPSYPIFTVLSFVGVALLAAGSWRTGLLPRWMLGLWPLLWTLGAFAAVGPMPLVLAVFFVAMGFTVTRRVGH
jgi:hypothetical protein